MALTTEVYLCKNTKLYPGSEDTYYFASEAARQAFFIGKSSNALHVTALSYQRENRTMRLALSLSAIDQCDYLMFKNTAYENKWYYAFLTDFAYINDGCTEISFVIDDLQTWLPSLTLNNQNIERETTATDTIHDTNNLVYEDFGTGEQYPYTVSSLSSDLKCNTFLCFVVKRLFTPIDIWPKGASSETAVLDKATDFYANTPDGTEAVVSVAPIVSASGTPLPQSYYYVLIPIASPNKITGFIKLFNGNVHAYGGSTPLMEYSDIAAIMMCGKSALNSAAKTAHDAHPLAPIILSPPNNLAPTPSSDPYTGTYESTREVIIGVAGAGSEIVENFTVDESALNIMFDGYTPKNKRCLQYPFVKYVLDDGNGGISQELHPELIPYNANLSGYKVSITSRSYIADTNEYRFCSIGNYNGFNASALTYEMPGNLHVTASFDTMDTWEALQGSYLQQKQNLNQFKSLISEVTQLFSGNLVGLSQSVLGDVSGELDYKHQIDTGKRGQIASVGNMSGNIISTARGEDTPKFIRYCCHRNVIEPIDAYFTKYGYKVNRYGAISLTSRTRFNFVKTQGFNASGSIPSKARTNIKAAFEKGVRFWKGDYLGDYSVTNSIAT